VAHGDGPGHHRWGPRGARPCSLRRRTAPGHCRGGVGGGKSAGAGGAVDDHARGDALMNYEDGGSVSAQATAPARFAQPILVITAAT
jgi:hypothetical protein